jgi:hypothetical protein
LDFKIPTQEKNTRSLSRGRGSSSTFQALIKGNFPGPVEEDFQAGRDNERRMGNDMAL